MATGMASAGISTPAIPIERMNGTGRATSTASPTPTATPEKITARSAVADVRCTASATERPAPSSSRNR
jgi:hypothetical protein